MRTLLLIPLLALAACSSAPPAQVPTLLVAPPTPQRPFLKDEVPDSALTCKTEPSGATVETSRQAATYVNEVRSAGRDCRQKLKGVRELIRNEQ